MEIRVGHIFSEKIMEIRVGHIFSEKIMEIRVAPVSATRPQSNNRALSFFEPVSEDDILKILKSYTTPLPSNIISSFNITHHM